MQEFKGKMFRGSMLALLPKVFRDASHFRGLLSTYEFVLMTHENHILDNRTGGEMKRKTKEYEANVT